MNTAVKTRSTTFGMSRMLLLASVLVFIIGIPLFVLPELTEINFAWTINVPLTAAFLGAAYWSSFCLEYLCSREKEWANARIAVPAVFTFTALTFIITLVHIDRFHFGSQYALLTQTVTWAWLVVYAVVPFILGWLWIKQSRTAGADPVREAPAPMWFRLAFLALGMVMFIAGVLLLVAPSVIAPAIWPWPLTALTGRAVGAWLVGLGIAAIQIFIEADFRRVKGALAAVLVLSILESIALLRFSSTVQLGDPRLWVFLLYLVLFFVLGLYGLMALRRNSGVNN